MNCDTSVTNATLKMTNGSISNLSLQIADNTWRLQSTFSNSAALDAAFPNGTYKLNIYTVRDGLKTNLTLYVTNTYPATVPHIGNFAAAQAIGLSTNFTLNWDAWSGGTTNDLIQLTIQDKMGIVFESPAFGIPGALNGTRTSFTIPAETLTFGKTDYVASLTFYRAVLNSSNYSGVIGEGGCYLRTDFSMQTVDDPEIDAPSFYDSIPYDTQTDVPLNAPIVFYFTKPMRPESAINWSANLNACNFNYTWLDKQSLLCLYKTTFPANATISWALVQSNAHGAFLDLTGNPLDVAQEGSFSTSTKIMPHDLTNYMVAKGQFFLQDSTNTPSLDTNDSPYIFSAAAMPAFDIAAITNGTVQPPAGPLITLAPDYFEDLFDTQAAMDAAYPNGSYVFKLYTIHEGIRTATNVLTGNAYPNTPRVSNFSEAQVINATNDFLLTWDAFAGGTVTDFVRVDFGYGLGSPDYGQPGALNGTNKSFLIPAGTLNQGQPYDARLLFGKITALNSNAYPGVPGVSMFYKATLFELATVPVFQPPEVLTFSLPNATQGVFYATTLAADGGEPPYTWASLTPLPAGLSLSTTGTLSGMPLISGTTNISFHLMDSTNGSADATLPLTILSYTNNPAFSLAAPARLANGQFQFSFNTLSGVNYTVLYSTTLTNWTALVTFSGSGGPITITDPNAPSNTRRFYRVKIGP